MPSDPRSVAGPKPPFSKGFSPSTDLNLERRWGWTPKFRRIDQEPEVRTGVMSSGWAVGMTSPRAAAPVSCVREPGSFALPATGGLPLAPFDGLEPFARLVRLPSSRQEFAFGLASRAFPVHGQAVPLRQISFRCPCGIGVNGRDPAFPSGIPSRSTRKRFQGQRRSRLVVPGKMHKLTEEAADPC